MHKRLIINADDFGLCRAQNYGIVEAFEHGVVSSTTAMVTSPAIEHAVWLSKRFPDLPIGLHFVLSWGRPLTPLSCLVNESGELNKGIWHKSEAGELDLTEIACELASQYQRFIALFGKAPTHIDSHHHVHMLPSLYPLVEAFARQQGIALRIDREALHRQGLTADHALSCARFDSRFYGEQLTRALLLQLLDDADAQGASSLEIMCHPAFIDLEVQRSAYNQSRLTELAILTDQALPELIAARGYCLTSYLGWRPS
ncbi:chitin disaccharide deacetylase [Aeromonas bestiarum]|uniref:chitin disaccharide deacetylase n=1 Tax=Aeromonas bestiarum TaxID=105751 RepID=UPI00259DA7EF|nr:chitin disaccharide deacetylase [Aeromonas bestiarum]MDM5090463.1 chitin disaccharide deacetylase [Aeromonas bestiarum]